MDLASPRLLKMLEKRWSPTLKSGNAPFRFGPAEGTAFFANAGWRESEWHPTWTDAMRLNRKPRGANFWNFLLNISPQKLAKRNCACPASRCWSAMDEVGVRVLRFEHGRAPRIRAKGHRSARAWRAKASPSSTAAATWADGRRRRRRARGGR
jgi:hypothetical protein